MPYPVARRASRRFAALLASGILALAVAGPALADVELSTASPGANEVVTGSPTELVVTFSGPIDPGRSSILVVAADGSTVAEGRADEVSADATTFTVPLPVLEAGAYEVRWTAVATDGHVARDTYTFTVEAPPEPSPSPSPQPSPSSASPEPSPSPASSPSPDPSPTPVPTEPAGGDDPLAVLLPIAIAVAAVAIVAVWWSRRRASP